MDNKASQEVSGLADRYRGTLLGLAMCDALGAPLEFRRPGTFEPLSGLVGGGFFGLQAGEWTDDTSQALCLAESLLERGEFDPADQVRRYIRWWKEAYLSSNGRCFDIGWTTRRSLERFEASGEFALRPGNKTAGSNGSLMRLAPVAMFYAQRPREAILRAAESSRTTHSAPESVDACRYFSGLLVGALHATPKTELLSDRYAPVPRLWEMEPLVAQIDEVASGSFWRRDPPHIKSSGRAGRTLEAALWAFSRTETFSDGALLAVNLGNDADTVGAVYGQLAGAYYGAAAIPPAWMASLARVDLIRDFTDRLFASRASETTSAARV